jgi:hypothetical protein
MARAIAALADDPVGREACVAGTLAIVRERSWEHEAITFVSLVEGLIRR